MEKSILLKLDEVTSKIDELDRKLTSIQRSINDDIFMDLLTLSNQNTIISQRLEDALSADSDRMKIKLQLIHLECELKMMKEALKHTA